MRNWIIDNYDTQENTNIKIISELLSLINKEEHIMSEEENIYEYI